MSRALSFAFALVSLALPALALADQAETVKAKGDCLDEIGADVRSKKVDFGARRHSRTLEIEDVEEIKLQPLSATEVGYVVKEHLDELTYCYEKLAPRARPTGEVAIHMAIEPEGHVSSVTARAPGKAGRILEKCIQRSVIKWRFPSANTTTQVDYPMVFDVAGLAEDHRQDHRK